MRSDKLVSLTLMLAMFATVLVVGFAVDAQTKPTIAVSANGTIVSAIRPGVTPSAIEVIEHFLDAYKQSDKFKTGNWHTKEHWIVEYKQLSKTVTLADNIGLVGGTESLWRVYFKEDDEVNVTSLASGDMLLNIKEGFDVKRNRYIFDIELSDNKEGIK